MNFKQFAAVVAAIALFAATAYLGVQSASTVNSSLVTRVESVGGFSSLLTSGADMDFSDFPSSPFLARIDVSGTIQPSYSDPFTVPAGYDHDLYMELVDALMDDDQNKGILLYVDSPGGTVYESDEMYLKLMQYREKTSRPIYAYFASEACSGGYYISMAANEIYANRNAWTGSIGVIISLMDYQGLSEKIGVKEVDITSGRNKAMGSAWEPMTDEQRGIFQSMVNEAYAQFVDIVTAGRKLDRARVLELADGRIYTAQQALDTGLIDHIAGEEDAFKAILEKAGLEPDAEIYVPARASSNLFTVLFSRAAALRPKSDLELFRELTADKRNGAFMYYAG